MANSKNKYKAEDEYVTSFNDISAELSNWTDKLKGKDIICPCDFDILGDGIESVTIRYDEFCGWAYYVNSVRKKDFGAQFDLFADFEKYEKPKEVSESIMRGLLNRRRSCNFVNYIWAMMKATGIHSVTASGYNAQLNSGVSFDEVDYDKYDVCLTNPPFSQYGRFMSTLLDEHDKRKGTGRPFDFTVISPFINRISPSVGIPLMERDVYLGYGRHLALEFINPADGDIKKVGCDWISTWPDAQERCYYYPLTLSESKEINSEELYEMPGMTMKDGTHPLHLKSTAALPDTDSWMFASAAVLDKLRYLDDKGYEWYTTGCKKYFNQTKPEMNPFNHKVSNEMIGYGTDNSCFHGIVFRKIGEKYENN